jgi:cell division protein FtsI (penicillin-binding protein 3)
MKIFSAAAAVEFGGYTPASAFYCEDGAYHIGQNVVNDTKPYGWLTLKEIIKYSSNIGAVKLGENIGPQSLHFILSQFGFGSKSGIDFPGETSGRLAPYQKWAKIDAGAISFGQGISVTALQLATATGAIANNGLLMKPYIVKAVKDPRGDTIQQFSPQVVRQAISRDTASIVTGMMRAVVEDKAPAHGPPWSVTRQPAKPAPPRKSGRTAPIPKSGSWHLSWDLPRPRGPRS